MIMKKILLLVLCTWVITACVDDYQDANPPARLDAPTIRVSAAGDNQTIITTPTNRFQSEQEVFLSYVGPTTFTVSVIDAPGTVGEISVQSSVPDYGTLVVDEASVASVQGKESGAFTFTFTPNPALDPAEDRALNFTIEVSDNQSLEGEFAGKTTTITLPVTLVQCVKTGVEGVYQVTAASGNIDGGAAYTLADLETTLGGPVLVEIIETDIPGRYTVNEVTGGVWPAYYPGRANPELTVNFCATNVTGQPGELTAGTPPGPLRTFTINGTLNGDGTVSIIWSYLREDAATPANPAKGTYTLTKQD
jgi:hypothetical protein